jgi:hypothetical protein
LPPIRESDVSEVVVGVPGGSADTGALQATVATTARIFKRAMRDPPSIPVDKPLVGKDVSSTGFGAALRDKRPPHRRHDQSNSSPLRDSLASHGFRNGMEQSR